MANKKNSKKFWSIFFIALLALVVIGLISYAIGYQIGSKMVEDTAVLTLNNLSM